jgi:shikimate kinase
MPGKVAQRTNLFLIGPMGAGKSTIGRCIAELLHREFLDVDHEVEARTGAAIPLIFEIEGEAGFRRREAAMIDELTRRDNIVLATGGGAVLLEQNRQILKERGRTVYLHAPLDTLVERTARDRNRPLLQEGDRRQTLVNLMKIREPLYREVADLVVETSQRPPMSVAREIVKKLADLETHENAKA